MIIDFLDIKTPLYCWDPYIYRFETDAINFKINIGVYEKPLGEYGNFGVTAREGLCIMFRIKGEKNWYNYNSYARKSVINVNMKPLIKSKTKYEVIIYGPILSKLNKLNIEIPEEYYAKKIVNESAEGLLIVGGMQSIGIGCTTAGVIFSNMLSREFKNKLYKITANNDNYINNIHNFLNGIITLPQADFGIIEINFNFYDEKLEKQFLKILEYIKTCCKKIICWFSIPKSKYEKKNINTLLKEDINSKKVVIKDFTFLYDEKHSDICTLNETLINDTGNILIYKELTQCIMEIKKWNI